MLKCPINSFPDLDPGAEKLRPRNIPMNPSYLLRVVSISVALLQCTTALADDKSDRTLDRDLKNVLVRLGFTGRIEETLQSKLGRPVNPELADLGRNLFFDKILSLKGDNACAGCHSPSRGFGDTQSIAIGIDNNNIVGKDRSGPRNQRRTPMVLNTAFFPNLMWNSRFSAVSGSSFNNSLGFVFPQPEGLTLSNQPHLLNAQAFIPPTERIEMAGFEFPGGNHEIRTEVINRLNESAAYHTRFRAAFPELHDNDITYDMLAAALAEFQISLTFANAPIDRFARGDSKAMSKDLKKGALLFFGKARCVNCHSVSGNSNEMFSDFATHVVGVPQISPVFTNAVFDGPAQNEDFGLEQVTGNSSDRYRFRSSPLRNVALQPTFFHNGAFTRLEDAIQHHLDVAKSVRNYRPSKHVAADLAGPVGPMAPVLARLDKQLQSPTKLTNAEFQQLVAFVRFGLLDERSFFLDSQIPTTLVSGQEPLEFEE